METAITKFEITDADIQTLVQANIIPKGTPPAQIAVFSKVCKEKRLSPFIKQIYLLPFNKKVGEAWEVHYATITGIDGYRTIAERTGRYSGNDDYRFNDGLTEYECRAKGLKNPITATATVYKTMMKERIPYTATAAWDSYVPPEKKRMQWDKMPYFMLGKCAEALALRKAFPESLSGIFAEEESGAFEQKQVQIVETNGHLIEILSDELAQQILTCDKREHVKAIWDANKNLHKKTFFVEAIKKQGDKIKPSDEKEKTPTSTLINIIQGAKKSEPMGENEKEITSPENNIVQ